MLTTTGFQWVRVYARGNALTGACYKVMTLMNRVVLGLSTAVTELKRLRRYERASGINRDNKEDRVVSDTCMS